MADNILQAKDLLKTTRIIKSDPTETLANALAKITRTHDAIFVFNTNNKFLGVVNPYYAIFKSKFPSETKLRKCLFSPPQLSLDTYIWDIARLMVESKVYFLPIFANGNFKGIVSVNRLLKAVLTDKKYLDKMYLITKKEIITIPADVTVGKAFNLMKDKQVARLPVVDPHKHLVGIVTRYDLRELFSKPKDSQRFLSRIGDKRKYLDKPLGGYYKKIVVTAKPTAKPKEILNLLVEREVGSVVIVDKNRRPVGIVSINDILSAIDKMRPPKERGIDLKVDAAFQQQARLEEILSRFVAKIDRFNPIRKAGFVVEGVKNPVGVIARYTVHGKLILKNGVQVVAKVTAHNWKRAVREVLNKVRRQLPR